MEEEDVWPGSLDLVVDSDTIQFHLHKQPPSQPRIAYHGGYADHLDTQLRRVQ